MSDIAQSPRLVVLPVVRDVAEILADPRNRDAAGRFVSRLLRPRSGSGRLEQVIAELKAAARAAGLTEEDIDAEFAAHKAQRRARQAAD